MHSSSFHWQVRVYYEDTDTAGVVYYANYLRFFERARTEWLRALGWSQQALAETARRGFVVTEAHIEYKRPARLDDLIDLDLHLVQVGRASLVVEQTAHRAGELLARARVKVGCVDSDRFAPAALPPEMLAQIRSLSLAPASA